VKGAATMSGAMAAIEETRGRDMLPEDLSSALMALIGTSGDTDQAKKTLREAIESRSRKDDCTQILLSTMSRKIFEMVKSENILMKMAGLHAMEALVDAEIDDSTTLLTRFANYLRAVLPCDDMETMRKAAKVLGHLVRTGDALIADLVDFEIKRALEALSSFPRVESRRLAAVLVLNELALSVPSLFYSYVAAFLRAVWFGLRDPSQRVRDSTATLALRACLALLSERNSRMRSKWFVAICEETMRGFEDVERETSALSKKKKKDEEHNHTVTIHGLFLALKELLDAKNEAMTSKMVDDIFDVVMRFKSHSNPMIAHASMNIMPSLARYDKFGYLIGPCTSHLLQAIKERNPATNRQSSHVYAAIADMASAAPHQMSTWIPFILSALEADLHSQEVGACRDALRCIAAMCTCMRIDEDTSTRLEQLLDPICVLRNLKDQATVRALSAITQHVPHLHESIQRKVLDQVCMALRGTRYADTRTYWISDSSQTIEPAEARTSQREKQPRSGAGRTRSRSADMPDRAAFPLKTFQPSGSMPSTPNMQGCSAAHAAGAGRRHALAHAHRANSNTLAALRLLSCFDFGPRELTDLACTCVVPRLFDSDVTVRSTAVSACMRILIPRNTRAPRHGVREQQVCVALRALMDVGVTDSEPSIRMSIWDGLSDTRYLCYASMSDMIRPALMALSDSVLEVREKALILAGKAALHNPASTLPTLRQVLGELLTALAAGKKQMREESAKMLGCLITHCSLLVSRFVQPIVNALLPRLVDTNPRVAAQALHAIGLLAAVPDARGTLLSVQHELFPMMVAALQDKTNAVKRFEALVALGRVAQGAGLVMEPFLLYPTLMPTLIAKIASEQTQGARKECIKTLGILGAIAPHWDTRAAGLVRSDGSHAISDAVNVPAVLLGAGSDEDTAYQGGRHKGAAVPKNEQQHGSHHRDHNHQTPRAQGAHMGHQGKHSAAAPAEACSKSKHEHVDFYTCIATHELAKILNDPSLSSYHMVAVQSVMFVLRFLGVRGGAILPQVPCMFACLVRAPVREWFHMFERSVVLNIRACTLIQGKARLSPHTRTDITLPQLMPRMLHTWLHGHPKTHFYSYSEMHNH
jgi:FKBP12-rapamycin complex-associated protein